METKLVYRYTSKAADGSESEISGPIRVGYALGESNHIEAEFDELHIEGTIEA